MKNVADIELHAKREAPPSSHRRSHHARNRTTTSSIIDAHNNNVSAPFQPWKPLTTTKLPLAPTTMAAFTNQQRRDPILCTIHVPATTSEPSSSIIFTAPAIDSSRTIHGSNTLHLLCNREPGTDAAVVTPLSPQICASTTALSLEKTTTVPHAVGATASIYETLIWEREGAATCHLNGH
ncbi:hypothetical protein DEO72_LG10g2555 [Vigna unguiculata]|uniref:Uncharacterized protein n=1 Tax=Vigna unguiculata TaxID=3917 RepID=A0A4D6NEK3_VIGUN|nr:hypothetical protein DEO72_LG10g2555 [Vigna unguiculata]